MKSYEEIAEHVLKARDLYEAKKKRRNKILISTAVPAALAACILLVLGHNGFLSRKATYTTDMNLMAGAGLSATAEAQFDGAESEAEEEAEEYEYRMDAPAPEEGTGDYNRLLNTCCKSFDDSESLMYSYFGVGDEVEQYHIPQGEVLSYSSNSLMNASFFGTCKPDEINSEAEYITVENGDWILYTTADEPQNFYISEKNDEAQVFYGFTCSYRNDDTDIFSYLRIQLQNYLIMMDLKDKGVKIEDHGQNTLSVIEDFISEHRDQVLPESFRVKYYEIVDYYKPEEEITTQMTIWFSVNFIPDSSIDFSAGSYRAVEDYVVSGFEDETVYNGIFMKTLSKENGYWVIWN